MSGIDLEFHSKHPTSAKLAQESGMLFPDGVTHDTRYVSPFPLFMKEGLGPYKWDVDGNEYVDYVGGHGAQDLAVGQHGHHHVGAGLEGPLQGRGEEGVVHGDQRPRLVPQGRGGL